MSATGEGDELSQQIADGGNDNEVSTAVEDGKQEGDSYEYGWKSKDKRVSLAGKTPAPEFVSLMGFLGGPMVKVFVGADQKLYTVPRDLLCRHSEFFRACFMGNFKEGHEQTVRLESIKDRDFEHMLQWITLGDITFSEESIDWEADIWTHCFKQAQSKFKKYLHFIFVADEFLIDPSPASAISDKMLELMIPFSDNMMIDAAIIEEAWTLPIQSGRPVRDIVLSGCITDYLLSKSEECTSKTEFIFDNELTTIPDFGKDLLDLAVRFVQINANVRSPHRYTWNCGRNFRHPLSDLVVFPDGTQLKDHGCICDA